MSDSRAVTRIQTLLLLVVSLLAAPAGAEHRVTVFAAASLGDVLPRIAQDYDHPVTFSFAGSGAIARQVAAGAPADLVIIANSDWAAWLETRSPSLRRSLPSVAGNRLAMIVPKGRDLPQDPSLAAHLVSGRLAMGHRDAVPAGVYARQWLEALGQWDGVSDNLAETDNVRAALTLVARGDAPLGIVYLTDAQAEPDVSILQIAAPEMHDPIRYPALALSAAGDDFLTFLTQPTARALFAEHGFSAQ